MVYLTTECGISSGSTLFEKVITVFRFGIRITNMTSKIYSDQSKCTVSNSCRGGDIVFHQNTISFILLFNVFTLRMFSTLLSFGHVQCHKGFIS